MKTVNGKIVSTKPVSLSKAATILSNFVSSDNGASQPVSTYLRRTSAAFNELVYLKKHHRLKKGRSKEEAATKSDTGYRSLDEDAVRVVENGGVKKKSGHDRVEVDESGSKEAEGKLRKKEKKRKKSEGSLGSGEKDNGKGNNETVNEKNEEKKKRKKTESSMGSGENDNVKVEVKENNETVNEKIEKKKKRKKTEGSSGSGENTNVKVEVKESNETVNEKMEEKKKKKRKNAEVDGGGNSVTPERKKRRKTEAED